MKTPHFGKVALVPKDAAASRARSATEIVQNAKETLREMGLEDYPKPDATPTPLGAVGDADSLTNSEIGVMYVQYISYAQYVGSKLAEMDVLYRIATTELKRLHAELSTQLVSRGVAKSEIPSAIRDSTAYQDAELEMLKAYAMKTMLQAVFSAYDKQAAALSRLMTLRELEFQGELRGTNMKNTRKRLSIKSDLRRSE